MTQTLSSFIDKLERLNSGSFIGEVRREVATEGLKMISAGFMFGTNPYGERWAERKRDVPWPTLYKSHALHDSFMAYPTPYGVLFENALPYAARQNYGDKKDGGAGIKSRVMLPSKSRGLPVQWNTMINKAYSKQVRKAVA